MCATTNDFNYLSTFPLTLKWIHWNGTTSEKPWTRATKHAHLHWCYSHRLNLKTHETAITSTHTNVCTYVTIKAVPLMYAQDVSAGSLLIKRQKMTKEINTYGSEKGWEKPVSLQLYVHSLWQVLQRAFATQKKVFFPFLKYVAQLSKMMDPFCCLDPHQCGMFLFGFTGMKERTVTGNAISHTPNSRSAACVPQPDGHMTVSLSSSTTGEGFSASQGLTWAECSSSGMWSSCPDDGMEFSETEPFFTYPGRFLCPFTGTGPSLVVRWRASGPLAVTLVMLVCDTIGP